MNKFHLNKKKSARSLPDLQFDTKHGYLLKLTTSDPLGLRVKMTHFIMSIKSYIFIVLIMIFNLIPNTAIFTGWPLLTPFKGGVEAARVNENYLSCIMFKIFSKPSV